MDYLKDLHETCETLSRELGEANEKIKRAGGKMSSGDLEYLDRLTHAIKSVKTTIAMMEAEEGEGESGYMPRYGGYYGRSYADGMNGDGNVYLLKNTVFPYFNKALSEFEDVPESSSEEVQSSNGE